MDIAQYRLEFRDFQEARERENLRRHVRPAAESRLASINERYSDLWSLESIAGLRQKLDETAPHFQTERAGVSSLIAFASAAYVDWRAKEISGEIDHCESLATIAWNAQTLPARQAKRVIAHESNEQRRRELDARRIDALDSCADLRIARFEMDQESAILLGYQSFHELSAALLGIDFARLVLDAQEFLKRSSPAYDSLLRRVRPLATSRSTYADYLYYAQAAAPLARLPSEMAFKALGSTLNEMGLRAEQQKNLTVQRGDATLSESESVCCAINPPEEVVLFVSAAQEGASPFSALLHEAARAQFYCWISRAQTERYPEFTYTFDGAISDGYGCLFRLLTHDPLWLVEHAKLSPKEAGPAAAAFAFLHASEVRRAGAAMECHLEQNAGGDFRAEHVRASCAESFTAATNFIYQPAQYLIDTESLVEAASKLRAWSFAAGLAEYMRTRHGSRWWSVRRAADELIDFWNTGSRYSVEELSRMIGFEPSNFELLIDNLSAAAKGE